MRVCRLQCCGLKVGEAPSAVPQRPDVVCGDRDTSKRPSPLVSPVDGPDTTDTILAYRRATSDPQTTMEHGLVGCSKLNKTPAGLKTSASIRDKISQWEGKKETLPTAPVVGSGPCLLTTVHKEPETVRKKEISEVHRPDGKRLVSWEWQDSGKEHAGKLGDLWPKSPEGPTTKGNREVILDRGLLRGSSKPTETAKENKSVLTHIKKLEQAMKEGPTNPSLVLPGNYFCPPSEELEEAERRGNEPIFGTLDVMGSRPVGSSRQQRSGDPENVYTEPGAACPSINPLPKPQRTFQHHTPPRTPASGLSLGKGRRNLPPLPPIPPPPLPTCPPPGVCRRPWADRTRDSSNRKSYEFEDLLQSSESSRVDWYAQSRLGLTRTLSEENVYEDILVYFNDVSAHSQRLSSVQSMLRQTGRCRTLERGLMDLQERKLFEYFIVVALQNTKAGAPYLPEVTQQFPLKLERSFKFMRETEDQLKVIPQFCFPDAKDWAPVDNFPSETFSFVLTGEDGSRRFGYCRRLLPSGKIRRLPEVYCIVSRLGCFDLFSKILDEVEKRRGISPALVQPFMRGIMEAPFPAPGRTITVKNFLPGSGTEVIELCRPSDSRLEHVDFECLFSSLSLRLLLRVFASLLLERRVIFTADKLSTLSQCCHAVVALLYPFTWQHTYIPVLPPSMLDIVCTPTPFIVGLLSSSLPSLKELPIEEVLVVDLGNSRFLRQLDDEDSILPHKLQAALEHVLDQRTELASEMPTDSSSLSTVVSETFVRFFVEMVGHYPLFMGGGDREDESGREAFRKAVTSKSLKRFLEVFMETQMFAGFVAEREQRRQGLRGLFEVRSQDYLDSLPGSEQRGVNKFLKGLGKAQILSHKPYPL
uniref:DENN domain containing 2A n=1 Tax=Hucho hucho TaxID=62062 RepID=A0A4W5JY33_9TELE